MLIAEPSQVVRELYHRYYPKDPVPPDSLTSSHWENLHKLAKVRISEKEILEINGFGFGDFQNSSPAYRFLSWLTIFCYGAVLKERILIFRYLPDAVTLANRMGLFFAYDAFRQVCAFHFLEEYLRKPGIKVLNIGDGYGFLSALIRQWNPSAQLICVDLGKTLFFQAYFCQKAFPRERMALAGHEAEDFEKAGFIFCPADRLESLNIRRFDVAINIASMQEMNTDAIGGYFRFLRSHLSPDGVFYCCNREEKIMPAGEISRIAEYPWDAKDRVLVDEICPWYRFFLSLRRASRGPEIMKMRWPLINYFDGNIRHRLVKLAAGS